MPPLTGAADDAPPLVLLHAPATRASITTPTPAVSILPGSLDLALPCRSRDDRIASPHGCGADAAVGDTPGARYRLKPLAGIWKTFVLQSEYRLLAESAQAARPRRRLRRG
jgi:hypothetical protein